jgi:hypothetical protein
MTIARSLTFAASSPLTRTAVAWRLPTAPPTDMRSDRELEPPEREAAIQAAEGPGPQGTSLQSYLQRIRLSLLRLKLSGNGDGQPHSSG